MAIHERVAKGYVVVGGPWRVACEPYEPTLGVAHSLHVESKALLVARVKRPDVAYFFLSRLPSFNEQAIYGTNTMSLNAWKR